MKKNRWVRGGLVAVLMMGWISIVGHSAGVTEEGILTSLLWNKFRDLPVSRRPKIALVLSGGGARGLAHIGVLRVLEREKVPIDLIVGTSVGALAGALYAAGVPVNEIEKMATAAGWDKLTNISATRVVRLLVSERLLSTEKMEKFLQDRMGDQQFSDLKIPLACVAADLRTGEAVVLREGSVSLAARASATMPGVFDPVPFRHRLLVDGGLVDNVPTDVAKNLGADVILCVNVPPDLAKNATSNVFTTLIQSVYIQGQVISRERLALADFLIEPRVDDVSALELWKSPVCIENGQRAAEARWPELKEFLVKKIMNQWARSSGGKS